jgi:hypothetical protein
MSDEAQQPVAPAREPVPKTLTDLYRKAQADLGRNPLVEWIFIKAKAEGRRGIAVSKLKRLESIQNYVEMSAASLHSDAARQIIMANGVDAIAFHRAEQELADATEHVTAAEGVIAMLQHGRPDATTHNRTKT